MNIDLTFRQVAFVFHTQDFWKFLDLEGLDDIFQDTIDSFERDNHHKIREKNYELKRQLFRKFEAAIPPLVPGKTTWSDVTLRLSHDEAFTQLDTLDRFDVFEDYMRETLERYEEDKRRISRRQARKYREAFLLLLDTHKDEINEETKWSDFVRQIKENEAYINLIGVHGSSQPYDLFAEKRSEWKRSMDT